MATKKRTMSDDHKAALAEGRTQSRAVARYLEALAATKPKRGRQRTPASIETRLVQIDSDLAGADELKRLNLLQQRQDLQNELAVKAAKVDVHALEADFVAAASAYGRRKGISYSVWREAGVAPAVLKKAGISRNV